MIIFDRPYVSDFLIKTVKELKIPVFDNGKFFTDENSKDINILEEKEFVKKALNNQPLKIYCNSENSINWIINNFAITKIPEYIEFCKDKVKFRERIKSVYPDFFFMEADFGHIDDLDISTIETPFIIKPAIGFFSIGVYKVNSHKEWEKIKKLLKKDIESAKGLYPEEVMNSSKLIIEECIDGEEFAIDAYYDLSGKPVILDILKHPFSSKTDVSDRIYYTSKEIIRENLDRFRETLEHIGKIAGFSNFPIHAEVRIDKTGKVYPIEFNPARFAGWCVTDIAYFAFGINIYEYYFKNKEPEWEKILEGKEGKKYSMVLIDFPKGLKAENIKKFKYDLLKENFKNILEFRKINYNEYPIFAIMFIETEEDSDELDMILKMKVEDYVECL